MILCGSLSRVVALCPDELRPSDGRMPSLPKFPRSRARSARERSHFPLHMHLDVRSTNVRQAQWVSSVLQTARLVKLVLDLRAVRASASLQRNDRKPSKATTHLTSCMCTYEPQSGETSMPHSGFFPIHVLSNKSDSATRANDVRRRSCAATICKSVRFSSAQTISRPGGSLDSTPKTLVLDDV
jgi:hypothetical protein